MGSSDRPVDVDAKAAEINKLRKFDPHTLRVTLLDGATRDVGRGTTRKYWAHMVDTVRKLGEWATIEAIDKAGVLLGLVRNPDIEIEEGVPIAANSNWEGQVIAMVQVVINAQDMALKRHEGMMLKLMSSMDVMLGVLTDGMRAVAGQYRTAMELQHASARAASSPGEDGYKPGDMSEAVIFEALKHEVPRMIRDFMGKKDKPKPNGKPKDKPPIDVDGEERPAS